MLNHSAILDIPVGLNTFVVWGIYDYEEYGLEGQKKVFIEVVCIVIEI